MTRFPGGGRVGTVKKMRPAYLPPRPAAHLDRQRRIDHHRSASIKTLQKGEETHEQDTRLRTYRARASLGAADPERSRRNRTNAAPNAFGGFWPDRERVVQGASAAKRGGC